MAKVDEHVRRGLLSPGTVPHLPLMPSENVVLLDVQASDSGHSTDYSMTTLLTSEWRSG